MRPVSSRGKNAIPSGKSRLEKSHWLLDSGGAKGGFRFS